MTYFEMICRVIFTAICLVLLGIAAARPELSGQAETAIWVLCGVASVCAGVLIGSHGAKQ